MKRPKPPKDGDEAWQTFMEMCDAVEDGDFEWTCEEFAAFYACFARLRRLGTQFHPSFIDRVQDMHRQMIGTDADSETDNSDDAIDMEDDDADAGDDPDEDVSDQWLDCEDDDPAGGDIQDEPHDPETDLDGEPGYVPFRPPENPGDYGAGLMQTRAFVKGIAAARRRSGHPITYDESLTDILDDLPDHDIDPGEQDFEHDEDCELSGDVDDDAIQGSSGDDDIRLSFDALSPTAKAERREEWKAHADERALRDASRAMRRDDLLGNIKQPNNFRSP